MRAKQVVSHAKLRMTCAIPPLPTMDGFDGTRPSGLIGDEDISYRFPYSTTDGKFKTVEGTWSGRQVRVSPYKNEAVRLGAPGRGRCGSSSENGLGPIT
jgi:hypothetical protein